MARAQAAAIAGVEAAVVRAGGSGLPDGRSIDALARDLAAGGHSDSPTAFSVVPGVYLEGETGVRIEDLMAVEVAVARVERLTRFPREVPVVGT